jgi:hypothetical protein
MFDDMLKCNQKTSCPIYLDDDSFYSLRNSLDGYIGDIKRSKVDACGATQQRELSYISQSEDICKRYEESSKTSAMMAGRTYQTKDCTKTVERENVAKSYDLCIKAIDGDMNIYWAKNQVTCLAKESERTSRYDSFCKNKLIDSHWNIYTKTCECNEGKSLLSNGTCGSVLAEILGKAFKGLNQNATTSVKATTIINTSENITSTLKVGSRGNEVKILQRKLGVEQTGYFGNFTKLAVIKFQKENNLPATGLAGKLTIEKLNSAK